MRDFSNYLNIINQNATNKYALATVIDVKGSAYRHEGATMLFSEYGNRIGTISAGCLEEDLSYHAVEVLEKHSSKIVTYDLSSEDDLTWGQSAGCNGTVTIYIEYVQSSTNHVWKEIEDQLSDGDSLICLKTMDHSTNIVIGLNLTTGDYFGNSTNVYLKRYLKDAIDSQEVDLKVFHDTNFGDLMIEFIKPKDTLYVFGAGHDVEPVVRMAAQLDFFIHVIDPRSHYCNKINFPNAHSLIVEHPTTYLERIEIPANSYVLIMTHNFNWDQQILNYFINNPTYYLGILGPRKRTSRLLVSENIPSWISSPVGVEIQAEGPEEISVSIAAELIQRKNLKCIRNQKQKKQLV